MKLLEYRTIGKILVVTWTWIFLTVTTQNRTLPVGAGYSHV